MGREGRRGRGGGFSKALRHKIKVLCGFPQARCLAGPIGSIPKEIQHRIHNVVTRKNSCPLQT
jgi:hypothetical protein